MWKICIHTQGRGPSGYQIVRSDEKPLKQPNPNYLYDFSVGSTESVESLDLLNTSTKMNHMYFCKDIRDI